MVQSQNQNENEAPDVKVTEMGEKSLKINVNLQKKVNPESDEEYDDNLPTPEILVTSNRQGRSIQGILKQRSRSHSESSDDLPSCGSYSRENSTSSGSHMSESPISESEEADVLCDDHIKKSVSFSEHVDQATFKPGTTVCSMTQALKSKRKRNRKREEKKRRRHNSTGSECSSSEEYPHLDEDLVEDFHVHSTADTKITNTTASTKSKHKNKSKKSGKQKVKEVMDNSAEVKADDEAVSLEETYRTSKSNESENCEKRKISNEICACEIKEDVCANVDTKEINAPHEGSEVVQKGIKELMNNDKVDSDDDALTESPVMVPEKPPRTKCDRKVGTVEMTNSCDTNRSETQKSEPDPSCSPSVTAAGDSNDTETMLSWEEQRGKSSEHATKCAFNFSNSVMFDLDVD